MLYLDFFHTYLAYSGLALKENADKTFYLAYDLLPKDNPAFHHEDHYSFDMVEGQNKLRTPQINNITLKVRLERQILKCTGKLIMIFFSFLHRHC